MEMAPIPTRVKPSKHLIVFEGENDQILINTIKVRPLLVERGKRLLQEILHDAAKMRETRKLQEKYAEGEFLIRILLDHYVLVNENDNEQVPDPCHMSVSGERRGMSLYLLVTQGCNLDCLYCLDGEKTYERSSHPRMNEEVAYRSIEICMANIAEGGQLEVVFFGGEPLLNWSLIKKCVDHCERDLQAKYPQCKLKFHLTTNLSVFPKDLIPFAKQYGFTFLVDIDGPARIHNRLRPFAGGKPSHKAISQNVRKLIDRGFDVGLRATITSHNVSLMPEIAEHHYELGARATAFVPLNPVNSDGSIFPPSMYPEPEQFVGGLREVYNSGLYSADQVFPLSKYIGKIEKTHADCLACGAPFGNTPTVAVNGDVYPCIYWVGTEKLKMFNVFEDNGYQRYTKLGKELIQSLHVDNLSTCKSCDWRYICGGGCPVHRVLLDPESEDYEEARRYSCMITCETTKSMISMLLWERARKHVHLLDSLTSLPKVPRAQELWPNLFSPVEIRGE